MNELSSTLIILTVCLVGIWIGGGLILYAVETIAARLHTTSFLVSFFVLGFLTSLTELTVAIDSTQQGVPQISVGNLIGGIVVLFLLVIPLLGLLGKGLKMENNLSLLQLLAILLMLISPIIIVYDGLLSQFEGLMLIIAYLAIGWLMYSRHPVPSLEATVSISTKKALIALGSIIVGVFVIVVASQYLVESTIALAQLIGVAPFLISLIGLSIGTNVPELSLAIRALIKGKKDVALGNYIGSAAFNLFILGALALGNNSIPIYADYTRVSIVLAVGLVVFYLFMYSKKELSRFESSMLLIFYVVFLISESLLLR